MKIKLLLCLFSILFFCSGCATTLNMMDAFGDGYSKGVASARQAQRDAPKDMHCDGNLMGGMDCY